MPKKIHVCLITDQPNILSTPLLDKRTKPHEVIIIASHEMQEKVDWFVAAAKRHKFKVTEWHIQDSWNVHTIQASLLALLKKYVDAELTLNAAGGTKAMNIAACHVFREANLPIFYVHPKTDVLMWVNPNKEKDFNLADKIDLDDYLGIRGAHVILDEKNCIDRSMLHKRERQLVKKLAQTATKIGEGFNHLNRLATRANADDIVTLKANNLKAKGLKTVLNIYRDAKFLKYNNKEIVFNNYQARWFASGGWLEAYTFDVLKTLQQRIPQIQDVARSVKVERKTATGVIPNEIDVAFLFNNSLHVIECKTQRFRRGRSSTGQGLKAIYKLDSLRDLLGGLRGKAMLVATDELSVGNQRRAQDLNIEVSASKNLWNLEKQIEHWIREQ